MYCYSIAANASCVLKELSSWTQISSEHALFVKKLSDLTKTKLLMEEEQNLRLTYMQFTCLSKQVKRCQRELTNFPVISYPHTLRYAVPMLKRFLKLNSSAIKLYERIRACAPADKDFLRFVKHIEEEHRYMYRLTRAYLEQLQ